MRCLRSIIRRLGLSSQKVLKEAKIEIKRLHKEAIIPQYQSSGAAGFDLCSVEALIIPPQERALVPTGIAIALSEGYELQVRPRSGLALKHGITVLNTPGTVDSDYRGELKIILINLGSEPFEIAIGDRIAQGILSEVTRARFLEVENLSDTERGVGGFGSTGRA